MGIFKWFFCFCFLLKRRKKISTFFLKYIIFHVISAAFRLVIYHKLIFISFQLNYRFEVLRLQPTTFPFMCVYIIMKIYDQKLNQFFFSSNFFFQINCNFRGKFFIYFFFFLYTTRREAYTHVNQFQTSN